MSETEIINGEITAKKRVHGSYIESYSCNCVTTCRPSGKTTSCSTHCQTCFRTHYTVDWFAESTIGRINLDRNDWTSPAVYALPDPDQYKRCEVGQPAAREHDYLNYIKAVPESLFHLNPMLTVYDKFIPHYPRVFDFYRVNRVLNVGTDIDVTKLNDLLNQKLKKLGPSKQVNVIVILTNIQEPTFKFAIENAWLAGNKNDVIVYLGLDGKKIVWADATVWVKNTGNEYAAVLLRDKIKDLGIFDETQISNTVAATIAAEYTRPEMEKFEYLLDQIQPPLWVVILAVLISIGGSLGLTYYFHKNEVF